jgi:hypothetical protein
MVSEGIAPLLLKFGMEWRRMVSFSRRPVLTQGYLFARNHGLGERVGLKMASGNFGKMVYSYPCRATQHAAGLYWVPGNAGVRGNEIADEFARGGSILGFLGTQPTLGVFGRDI